MVKRKRPTRKPPARPALRPSGAAPPPRRRSPDLDQTQKEGPLVRSPAGPITAPPDADDARGRARCDTENTDVSPREQLRDRVVLLRLDGPEAGRVYVATTGTCAVGRHADNDLVLDDLGVSRFHARITWLGNAHAVDDLASSNGTFVRGERVTRAVLADGDLVQFGPRACFRYAVTDALQERLLRLVSESGTRDPLTGAYNRRHIEERLRGELAYTMRHDGELSVVLVDVDRCRQVVDAQGPVAGDAVLRHVADLAQAQLRKEDVFGRYGDDQFLIVLRGTDVAHAARVAERLRATVERVPARHQGNAISVTLSAGCASLDECASPTAAALLAQATERLAAAKKAGRNRVAGAP